jgi:hypothetical protein
MSISIKDGSVWRVSFIKVAPGQGERYIEDVGPKRKRVLDQAIDDGLIISYKMFNGLSMGRDDWDFMFMIEYKNWGAIDGLRERLADLNQKLIGDDSVSEEALACRSPIREMIGEKFMQEFRI